VTIYSVGYGNRGFEAFLALLRQYKFTHLVDVRAVPQSSYWEDFRRERLSHLLNSTEIKYVYMGDTLGGVFESPVLCKDPFSVDIEPLRLEERLHLGVSKVMRAAGDPNRRIVLMCGCLRPHRCHRSRLLGPALIERGVEYLHVLDEQTVHTQAEIEALAEPQASLF